MTLPDIAAVTLRLKARKTNTLPAWLGQAAQACFLASLKNINPQLSAIIHDGSVLKPFTCSNLIGMQAKGRLAQIHPHQTLHLRFTTLHSHVTALMLNGMLPAWCSDGIMLHDQPLEVIGIESVAGDGQPETTTFEQLIANAVPAQHIGLKFVSPTAFKATAGHTISMPQPEQVFRSLLDKWNKFSPQPFPKDLYEVIPRVVIPKAVNTYQQTVCMERSRRGSYPGFVGKAIYHLQTRDKVIRQQLATLAAFGVYCGVGAKTTFGLGQMGRV